MLDLTLRAPSRVHRMLPGCAIRAAWIAASLTLAASNASAAPKADSLYVVADSSLVEAFRDLGAACCDSAGSLPPRFEFAGNRRIEKQLAGKSLADVVAMADSVPIQTLWRAGKLDRPRLLGHGRLAVIAPQRDTTMVSYMDLWRPGVRIASGEPGSPLGRYTDVLLIRIQGMRRKSADLVTSIRSKLSRREASSRAVIERVMRGEADAGIIFATDLAAAGDKVRALQLPENMSPLVEYYVAPVVSGKHRDHADAFVEFAAGESGRPILRRDGFIP